MRFAAPFLALLVLTLPASAAPDSTPRVEGLEKISTYQQGIQALADHLPELAVERFQEAYKVSNLSDAQNREILYRLTEAQVRANQPEKALITLNSKFFTNHPEREFWIAQAYAAQGKYSQAIEHFQKLDEKSAYLDDATLSLASLQMALQQDREAIKNYLKASQSNDRPTKFKATATLAEIYLERGSLSQAKRMINSMPAGEKSSLLKRLLDAKFAAASNNHQEAIEKFSSLFDVEQQLPPRLYQIALIGLADARHAAGQTQEASEELLRFVREHKDSPLLLPIFERLSAWSKKTLSTTDPLYRQLQKWSNHDAKNPSILSHQISSDFITPPLASAKALSSTNDYLSAISLYYYAKHTAKLDTAGCLQEAQFLFSCFRAAYPEHPLLGASFLETANIQLALKQRSDALHTLRTLSRLAEQQQVALPSEIKAQAGFIAGMLSVEAEEYPQAQQAFAEATTSNNKALAKAANINLGLAALRSADLAAFDAQMKKITDSELTSQLTIERALWLAHQKHAGARDALSSFLLNNPQNSRAVDARIALATICATQPPLDPLLCKALIDTVDSSDLSARQLADYTRTRYLLAELQQEWPKAIATLDWYLTRHPDSTNVAEFSMRKGLALYRNGEHNKARQLLGQIAIENPESPLTTFCHYYAGMAARLEGTPQALKESVDIFEKVIISKSSLAIEARIQQARVLLDINRTEEAKISLFKVYKPKSNSAQQREIGILLATALHTQGSEDPGQYSKAIAIYDQLLETPKLPLSWSNQVYYMKGQTLESMGDDKMALDSYYRVINRENLSPDAPHSQQEWQWFYKCGFKAVALLEKKEQYRAAVAISKKIASYQGPESEAYKIRARALEMKHMIWEE